MDTQIRLPIFGGSYKTRHLHCVDRVSHEKDDPPDQNLRETDLDEETVIDVQRRTGLAACVIAHPSKAHALCTHLTTDFHLPAMAPQDKKTTEANTRALRELLKQPDNKVCADCKRNGASRPRSESSPTHLHCQTHVGPHGICEPYFYQEQLPADTVSPAACFCASDALGFTGPWGHTSARLNLSISTLGRPFNLRSDSYNLSP